MQDASERLAAARRAAGFSSAAKAAEAMGIGAPAYAHHENGTRGFNRSAERYARFFRVSLEWLLTGKGEMRPRRTAAWSVPVAGMVGAGAAVEPIEDAAGDQMPDRIEWPEPEVLAALIVHGDSQVPRYMPGEVIIYDARPRAPRDLLNRMAVVQCEDGRRLIKRIRRGTRMERWSLESLNANLEEDVALLAAYEIVGALTRR